MTYYKNEGSVEVAGTEYEFTIQQVRHPDSEIGQDDVSAWINGNAVYLDVIENNPELIPCFELTDRKSVNQVEDIVAFLIDTQQLPCKECDSLKDISDMRRTNFAGCICVHCKHDCNGSEGHDYKCLNPSTKHNACLDTKYKCQDCGNIKRDVATA